MPEISESANVPSSRSERSEHQPLTFLTFADVPQAAPKESAVMQFGRAFAHTLVQAPVEGIAQLVDGKAGGPTQKAVHFIDAPEAVPFGSSAWMAQQAGSGLGAILPVLAVHKGISGALGRSYSARTALAMSENMAALGTEQAIAVTSLKLAHAGLTGMVYSGVLTPAADNTEKFWQARAHNAAVGGIAFTALTGSGMGLKALSEKTATSMPIASRLLSSDIVSGTISGLPAGIVAANADSLLSGQGFASGQQQWQSAATFAFTGGGLAFGKTAIGEIQPTSRTTQPTGKFADAGVDVDGRPISESGRAAVQAKLPEYSEAALNRARSQTLRDLSEIKALEPGKSVLDQFRDSDLSISQKYRVLNSLGQVREHFVNQRTNGHIEPDQQGNWIHTQGEFGRVIDAARTSKLNPVQTEDSLLASMFADSVKSKANFFTHHMEGALAADIVASNEFGAGFDRTRLDGIVHSVREHQIGPPEFMSNLYANRIRAGMPGGLTPEQETALGSLQRKIADPLNPSIERYTTADGGTALKLTPQEQSLLQVSGVREWYVPNDAHPWNPQSRTVIDGDSIDNYFTPGGIGKIAGLGGPESDKWFMTKQIDNKTGAAERATNIGSARLSGADAAKLITPESRALADNGLAQTEAAVATAKTKLADWLRSEKGIDPDRTPVPFFNADLKYPEFGENDAQWWNIHRSPADKRSPDQQAFYDQHRFDGLSPKEQNDFLLAKEIRNRLADELRAAQRLDGRQPPEYVPATGK